MKNKKGSKKLASWRYSDIKLKFSARKEEGIIHTASNKKTIPLMIIIINVIIVIILIVQITRKINSHFSKGVLTAEIVRVIKFKGL